VILIWIASLTQWAVVKTSFGATRTAEQTVFPMGWFFGRVISSITESLNSFQLTSVALAFRGEASKIIKSHEIFIQSNLSTALLEFFTAPTGTGIISTGLRLISDRSQDFLPVRVKPATLILKKAKEAHLMMNYIFPVPLIACFEFHLTACIAWIPITSRYDLKTLPLRFLGPSQSGFRIKGIPIARIAGFFNVSDLMRDIGRIAGSHEFHGGVGNHLFEMKRFATLGVGQAGSTGAG
jgi:hypothetical protein